MGYFGPSSDPLGALQKYLDQRDDLHAGRIPRVTGDRLTVRDLLNRFFITKKHLADTVDKLCEYLELELRPKKKRAGGARSR